MKARLTGLGLSGAFVSVTSLFFAWGFISSNNDPLIVMLRAAFGLNYSQGLLVQQVSFLANGLAALPAAALGNRIGAARTILLALGVMISGCLLVRVAIGFQSYPAVLAAMLVLAIGINGLQVSANPLAASLGPVKTSHFRLSLAQTFNSLGVVLGVHYGAAVMLGERVVAERQGRLANEAERIEALATASQAFLLMAGRLAALATFFWSQRRRITAAVASLPPGNASVLEALRSRWALAGAAAIALYVGAEVSIGSIMINFLHRPGVLGLPFAEGGRYLANFYWGGALAGRLIGSLLLTRVAASRLLLMCGLCAAGLCGIVVTGAGSIAGFSALAVGLFNSIMFPTIFSITLERSGASQSSTSGLLCLAILGGALLPLLVGALADTVGLQSAFAVPCVAYFAIATFALAATRQDRTT